MRVAIGFMFQNEQEWLELMLSCFSQVARHSHHQVGFVGIDGGSTDGSATIASHYGVDVRHRPFDWDFAAQQNALIEHAEFLGYDAIFLTAPDELMFPDQVAALFDLLPSYKAIALPRLNFEGDRLHYCPHRWPDWQFRMWMLHAGVRWTGRLHASLEPGMAQAGWRNAPVIEANVPRDVLWLPHAPIYHYEGLRSAQARTLKRLNYQRLSEGLPPLSTLPDGVALDEPLFRVPYVGPQPLDPLAIGVRAPVERAAQVTGWVSFSEPVPAGDASFSTETTTLETPDKRKGKRAAHR